MSILFLRWAVLMKNVSFYYMHLLYTMDDINTKVGICLKFVWNCFEKVSIFDGKCENLLFEWTVQIGKVSIFFEINIGDGKSERLFSIWYLRWQSPYPLSYPLLVVFYGIKWRIRWKRNPKFVKIDLNEWNLVIFEWNLNGINEIRGIDAVWSLDLQLFEWHVC